MAHKSRKAKTNEVKASIKKSIKKHHELMKRLQEEEKIMINTFGGSANTGFKGKWDFSIDSSSFSDDRIITDRVSEPFEVYVYVNPCSTEFKARKLTVFGE